MSTPTVKYDQATALAWSISAMDDATDRINRIADFEPARAFAAIGEAVWWITIVDDNLKHNFRTTYDVVQSGCVPNPADTLLGLRSVRNRIGHGVELADFIYPIASRPDPGDGRITAWGWNHVPPPTRGDMREGQYRAELRAYDAYESAVVDGGQGGNIVYTFMLVPGFLHTVHERSSSHDI